MNKLLVVNDEIKEMLVDKTVNVSILEKSEDFSVNCINIEILKDTELEINYTCKEDTKLYLCFNVRKNVDAKIFEVRTGSKGKVQYNYNLNNESNLTVNKFYDCASMREVDVINLDGFKSKIEHHLKTISKDSEKYDMVIYHNNNNTISNIYNNGVNILDGSLIFNVTGVVPNGKKDCDVSQENRIITMNNNKCSINPNLLIDENDVSANHSALIGKFNEDEIFYLKSRGISENEAINLLVKGVLLSKLELTEERKETLTNIIDKYWR